MHSLHIRGGGLRRIFDRRSGVCVFVFVTRYLHGEEDLVCCSHLGISQRISGLEGVCDMLIIGGMLSSSTGKVAILVGLCVSHFCANTWKSPASATTFYVCPVACTKCLFFVTQHAASCTRHLCPHGTPNCRQDAVSLLCNSSR
jgi:hypothetical protein